MYIIRYNTCKFSVPYLSFDLSGGGCISPKLNIYPYNFYLFYLIEKNLKAFNPHEGLRINIWTSEYSKTLRKTMLFC